MTNRAELAKQLLALAASLNKHGISNMSSDDEANLLRRAAAKLSAGEGGVEWPYDKPWRDVPAGASEERLPSEAAERYALSRHLQGKPARMVDETVTLLRLRLAADATNDDAKLSIVYSQSGAFRRVLVNGLTGAEIKALAALRRLAPAQVSVEEVREAVKAGLQIIEEENDRARRQFVNVSNSRIDAGIAHIKSALSAPARQTGEGEP